MSVLLPLSTVSLAGALTAVFVGAAALTPLARRYALSRRLVDVPGHRSSHATPTPRGGGVAIVVAVLVTALVGGAASVLPWSLVWALVGGAGLVALLGFMDDHGHVPAGWRLVGHFAAGVWVILWMGGPARLPVLFGGMTPGLVAAGLALLYLVWLVNLTNFMDGIDGLAGVEVVTACLAGAVLYRLAGGDAASTLLPLAVAAASAGFLIWNWPPARIFMGDTGSGFLGLTLGILSLHAARVDPVLFWGWTILLGVFVVDATATLLRRLLRMERIYEAHRTHAYQHAARRWGSHGRVALTTAAINVLWLFPIAALVSTQAIPALPGLAVAYTPILLFALYLGAGAPESER